MAWNFLKRWFGRSPALQQRRAEVDLERVDDLMEISRGYPRVRWEDVRSWIRRDYSTHEWHSAWTEVAARWLGNIKRHLGGNYDLFESENFLLLTYQGQRRAREVLRLAEKAYFYLFDVLQGSVETERAGKLAILVFDGEERYFDYLEEHDGNSVGVFISEGYAQIVLDGEVHGDTDAVMVHELAHATLEGVQLPRWVDEGIAQIAEDCVTGRQLAGSTPEEREELRAYWKQHGMESFWSGSAFLESDSSQMAYRLAELITRNILSAKRQRFGHFILNAARNDGGAQAAQSCLNMSLSQIAGMYLGDGDWS